MASSTGAMLISAATRRKATRDELAVEFAYADAKGAASHRRVNPLGIVYLDQSTVLLSWCHLRRDFKVFRLDRMQGLVVTGQSFRPARAFHCCAMHWRAYGKIPQRPATLMIEGFGSAIIRDRLGDEQTIRLSGMRVFLAGGIIVAILATGLSAGTVEVLQSPRPVLRPDVPEVKVEPIAVTAGTESFQDWVAEFRPRAIALGIGKPVLDLALQGVRYDPDVVQRDRNQSEFTKTIWDYLKTAVSDLRISNGKVALQSQRRNLEAIERKYGVDKQVVVAIWGLESAYGTFRGKTRVIGALASLAYDARRSAFFEEQLIAALRILQSGDTTPDRMTGSWAGAMGHTQFMPGSYLEYAVDFDGDGRRDIWSDDPVDALASAAAYLQGHGWIKGQPWGVEVTLPKGFDYLLANRSITKPPADWAALGVVGLDGKPVPEHGLGAVLLPGGAQGAAFMIFDNFTVLEAYNTADAYVIGVGHLADRIIGGGPIQGGWPVQDRALTHDERIELQQRLTRAGFDTQKIDAKIGPLTIAAVRAYQLSNGLVPDGYASLGLLKGLR